MTSSAATFSTTLEVALKANARLGAEAAGGRGLSDSALLAAQRSVAEAKRSLDACASVLAGEVVRRSSVEAGFGGLARKEGFRTPEALIRGVTGSTAREATTLIRVGSMLNDADLLNNAETAGIDDTAGLASMMTEPWLAAVGRAVAAGALSVAGAEAIRTGLGRPGPGVTTEDLTAAATKLVATATERAAGTTPGGALDAEQLLRLARTARDDLDAAGIVERERQRRALRSFRRWKRDDGMTRYTWDLDPEGAALIDDVYDKLTSPRRGGPRFTTGPEQARAEQIIADTRTTEQLASDGMLELIQLALDTDPQSVVGVNRPAVRVLVAATDLTDRTGRGWIEGQDYPVSIATVERNACLNGIELIVFDDRPLPVNLGREQRFFNRAQRRLLAARDGGCAWPDCDRPPEWTEAHHIRWWERDGGTTDIDNGILLCRHHHLLLHDEGWEIETRDHDPLARFWLIPPRDIDPTQTPRPMPSKSPALNDALTPGGRHHAT
ncbi:HNH endonuclease signature motif containing protein [Cryobacterium sp. BB736]|uniref:HNH endonuclease signature motif containing protein n=1 Tax=Cryobacterium sp. BB736 TaxID=2746963 RepID=UPI001874E965|nr:HNH endonuclease signature motif containing protein [Cryobacterium sp. BB736]